MHVFRTKFFNVYRGIGGKSPDKCRIMLQGFNFGILQMQPELERLKDWIFCD